MSHERAAVCVAMYPERMTGVVENWMVQSLDVALLELPAAPRRSNSTNTDA